MLEMLNILDIAASLLKNAHERLTTLEKRYSKIGEEVQAKINKDEQESKHEEKSSSFTKFYTMPNISLETLKEYLAITFLEIRALELKITEIKTEIENNKTLKINFIYFNHFLYNRLDNYIHKGSNIRLPIAKFTSNVEYIYRDEITDNILTILEKTDVKLRELVSKLLKQAVYNEIEVINLSYPYSMYDIGKKLIKIISNNQFIKYVKFKTEHFDYKFLKTEEFISAINSANNLYGIELQERSLEPNFLNSLEEFANILGKIGVQRAFYLQYSGYRAIGNIFALKPLGSDKGCTTFVPINRPTASKWRTVSIEPLFVIDELPSGTGSFEELNLEELNFKANSISDIFNQNKKNYLPDLIHFFDNCKELLNQPDDENWYPIDYAVWKDDYLSLLYLIQHAPALSTANNSSTTLHRAVQFSSQTMLVFLLKQTKLKECLEYMDEEGNTPFCLAARYDKTTNLETLISGYGVNINHKNHAGKTALELAFEAGNYGIVEILLKNGAEISAPLKREFETILAQDEHPLKSYLHTIVQFHDAIYDGELDKINQLIQNQSIDINRCLDFNNHTPLFNTITAKRY